MVGIQDWFSETSWFGVCIEWRRFWSWAGMTWESPCLSLSCLAVSGSLPVALSLLLLWICLSPSLTRVHQLLGKGVRTAHVGISRNVCT